MIADQIAAVREELLQRPPGLVRHVRRVLDEALPLARHWLADEQRVELAVWGHDLFRSEPPEGQLRLAREVGVEIDTDSRDYPILLHGPIAAIVLRERFGITDEEALMAVRDHTSGPRPDEPARQDPAHRRQDREEEAPRRPRARRRRRIARRDLDTAILCWADWRWTAEARERYRTQEAHWRARRGWVEEHHRDIGMPERVTGSSFAAAARREGLAPPTGS